MIRALLLSILAAAASPAAVIRGTVVENFTGKLLTRALVILQPMQGTPGGERTMRTDRLGGFSFDALPAGVYVLKASRRGFLPVEYGQKRWNSAGQPITIGESETGFYSLRLPRYAALSGTVVDENEIGLPDYEVAVYRATRPLTLIGSGKTDDRGQYRVGGLTPGRYFVRTAGRQYEDGSYTPTYSRETTRADQAQTIDVYLEQETAHADVRPLAGRTYRWTVGVSTDPPEMPVRITLASDTGRTTVQGVSHTFTGLAPGEYDVYAESLPGQPPQGAYERIFVNRDGATALICGDAVGVNVTGDSGDKGILWFRRKDLAGAGEVQSIPAKGVALPPGRWELLLHPPDGFHVAGIFGGGIARRDRADAWNEAVLRRYAGVTFRLGSGAGSVTGVVKDGAYAPVYLEGYEPLTRQRAGELWTARADSQGRYRFEGLAPGAYRLLATFEYLAPDTEMIDSAAPVGVQVTASGVVTNDLDLWVIR